MKIMEDTCTHIAIQKQLKILILEFVNRYTPHSNTIKTNLTENILLEDDLNITNLTVKGLNLLYKNLQILEKLIQ